MKNNRLNLVCLTLVMVSATANAFHGGGGHGGGHMGGGLSHSGGALDHSGHMNRSASPVGARSRHQGNFDHHGDRGYNHHNYNGYGYNRYNNYGLLGTGIGFGVDLPLAAGGYYGYSDYPYDDYDDNGYNDYSYDY